MQRAIKNVVVLGSGVMGSRIACHFAGVGVQVLLLDRLTPGAETSENKKERNKLVNDALQAAIKSNPSPLYASRFSSNITTGNFTDDIAQIAKADWIIEVVIERLDIKKDIYNLVEQYRKPGTLVSSNTSGIPIHLMAEGRSDDFQKHFCGTHFFNPPRYLRLLEIIPTAKTDPAVIDFHLHYGDVFLGKTTVLCKDTPAFIANRVGVFSMMSVLHIMEKLGLTIDEIESLTGPIMGRPKSATFRTADVVGLDTLVKVANGVAENCPTDEAKNIFALPTWLVKMVEQNWLGDKTGQGFFKKVKTATSKEILTLNLKTFEYEPRNKPKFASIAAAKAIESAGAFAIVLEMVPADLAIQITKELSIPTVGIGAGNGTDAQVLVWTDAFGITKNPPKLAKAYRNLRAELLSGAQEFAKDVLSGEFPSDAQTFK